MTAEAVARTPRLLIRKSIEQIQAEATSHHLKRTLGPANLVFFGIGCIIGAGIYVMTGNAAANYAGPAVLLSFVIAGFACAFAGLCYAELASAMPVAGSAYTYSYATLGEVFAWIMGWLLVLEYGVAAATVAVGWSGYVASFLKDLHVVVPAAVSTSLVQSITTDHGLVFSVGHGLNLVAAAGILAVTSLLVIGVSESAKVNNVIVFIKVGVLVLFVAMGVFYIKPHNWTPFIPASQGGFVYGVKGIFRAASVIFFAYVGFEAVSTAAAEARNPQRDMPVGILGSLFICTIIYMSVAAVLTGVVPFRQLGVPEPIALAVDQMHQPVFSYLIKIGAIAGLSSVMLILTYGQTRVFYAMARDGLLPGALARLHSRFRTPWIGTIVLGSLIAVLASLLPITILGDLVSLGTACAFGIVCLATMYLRTTKPDIHRPFHVPGGGGRVAKPWIILLAFVLGEAAMVFFHFIFTASWAGLGAIIVAVVAALWLVLSWPSRKERWWIGPTPVLGIIGAITMAEPLIQDIIEKALRGDRIPATLLGGYIVVGAVIYLGYGLWNSRLAKGLPVRDEGLPQGALDAIAHGVNPDG
ncbi:MAG: amino acid permease [Caulobacteraceae bacterium]